MPRVFRVPSKLLILEADADILYLTQTIQLLEGRSYTVSLQWIYGLDSLTWLDCGQTSVAEIMQ